jgi:hypothetical protein
LPESSAVENRCAPSAVPDDPATWNDTPDDGCERRADEAADEDGSDQGP